MMWRNNKLKEKVLKALESHDTLVVFDTETTGLSPATGRIIEFGAVKLEIENGTITDVIDKIDVYIRPPFEVSETIESLTGITNERLEKEPFESKEIAEKIRNFMGDSVLVAHNAKFDVSFIKELFLRQEVSASLDCVVDTLEIARDLNPDGSHKLGALADKYGVAEGVKFHNALEDATVTAKLFKMFVAEYKALEETPECFKETPVIHKISYWKGFKGHSRIYVATSLGDLFYDLWNKCWGEKQSGLIEKINMDYIESSVCLETKCLTMEEFEKFKGSVRCS